MKVLYFTSTGNCLYAARAIGGEQISVVQTMKQKELEFSDDAIGIVFPVYGLCVPPVIKEFLSRASFKCGYLFAVITFGTFDAGSAAQLQEFAKGKGIVFNYINTLNMGENYLPGFDMAKTNAIDTTQQDTKLAQIAEDIRGKKQFIKKNSGFDKFLTWTHVKAYHYNVGEGLTGQFTVSDACLGCGICAQVCPQDNITIENSRPSFSNNCASCLACAQNCPHGAISLKNQKSAERYRNPNVTLNDIINANK